MRVADPSARSVAIDQVIGRRRRVKQRPFLGKTTSAPKPNEDLLAQVRSKTEGY